MEQVYYAGLDIHKKTIAFCIKQADGTIVAEGKIEATRKALQQWEETIPGPWIGAMEATLFTGWVYDFFKALCAAAAGGQSADDESNNRSKEEKRQA